MAEPPNRDSGENLDITITLRQGQTLVTALAYEQQRLLQELRQASFQDAHIIYAALEKVSTLLAAVEESIEKAVSDR